MGVEGEFAMVVLTGFCGRELDDVREWCRIVFFRKSSSLRRGERGVMMPYDKLDGNRLDFLYSKVLPLERYMRAYNDDSLSICQT